MNRDTIRKFVQNTEILDIALYPDDKPNGELDSIHIFCGNAALLIVNWQEDGIEVEVLGPGGKEWKR